MADRCGAKAGDMVFILCGKSSGPLTQLALPASGVAQQLDARPKSSRRSGSWTFPLFDGTTRRSALLRHAPSFTSPKLEDGYIR